MTTLKRSQLVAAAKELNEQLGLEPAIDTKPGKKNKDLEKLIKEASELVDPKQDEFSDETWEVLKALGIDTDATDTKAEGGSEPEEEQPEEGEGKPDPDPEPDRSTEPAQVEAPAPEPEKPAKGSGKTKSTKKATGDLSNKAKVYQAWQKGETDIEKLNKIVDNVVKETTIKSWVNQWKKGKNLPAIAKK